MTKAEIQRLKELAEKETSGPWQFRATEHSGEYIAAFSPSTAKQLIELAEWAFSAKSVLTKIEGLSPLQERHRRELSREVLASFPKEGE